MDLLFGADDAEIVGATSREVVGSRPDYVIEFVSIYLILPAALGPGVHSASNRNEYQKHENNVPGEWGAAGAQGL
jgi:hypothetical protein